jgi:hypothetical protein
MSAKRRAKAETLSISESAELEAMLGDGFAIYGSWNHSAVSLEGIVDEPFFGAFASAGTRRLVSPPSFIAEMRAVGSTDAEIAAELEDYVDASVSDDAPHWRETNPFNFNLSALEKFFRARVIDHYESDKSDEPLPWLDEPLTLVGAETPFSKIWFELTICSEFRILDLNLEYAAAKGNLAGHAQGWALASAGKIGRLAEHYRWRFSYGADAMRGRTNVQAARSGAEARARELADQTQVVLTAMKTQVAAGKSISRAATIVFRSGLGASPEANRKLWTRHRAK